MSSRVPVADLSDVEALLRSVLVALQTTQARHQFHDPESPRFDVPAELLQDEAAYEMARAEYLAARNAYLAQRGRPDPRDALPLALLWDALVCDEEWLEYYDVPKLEPSRRDLDDMFFEHFAISQRRVEEDRSPHGWLPRSYFVGIPTGDKSFRCIVHEASGRTFCTETAQQNCAVPPATDFGLVRVSGMAVDYKTGERKPSVMPLYLPTQFGKWCIVVGHYGESAGEEIVGYGEA